MALFTDKETGSTIALPLREATPERVAAAIDRKRRDFREKRAVLKAADRKLALWEHRAAASIARQFRAEHEDVRVTFVRDGAEAALRRPADLAPHMEGALRGVYAKVAADFSVWALRAVRALAPGRTLAVAKADPFVEDQARWIREQAARKVVGIADTTRERLRATIELGVQGGETVQQVARRIDDLYLDEIIPNRSMVIARTEVGASANFASHDAAACGARQAGFELNKVWNAIQDDRTRDDHADADGQVVAMSEPFQVGGDLLAWPGDPAGDPEQIIQCRCFLTYEPA